MMTQRFVALNDSAPCLHVYTASTACVDIVHDPASVMPLVVQILRANFSKILGPAPPLVESLIKLIESLHAASSPAKG